MAVTGLRLFGVRLLPRDSARPLMPGVDTIIVRDLAAIVRVAPFAPVTPTPENVAEHQRVVDAAFLHGAVIPAPCGTVFRSAELVREWLDEHYIALSEGLHFIIGRCEARVHVTRANGGTTTDKELATLAAECFRALRREAAAAVPLPRGDDGEVLGAGFLIPVHEWADFSEHVRQQSERFTDVRFEQTGPWPPYDFVRMDFGV